MANKRVSYEDFCKRAANVAPWAARLDPARSAILSAAWEECAWISVLTNERLLAALESACDRTLGD